LTAGLSRLAFGIPLALDDPVGHDSERKLDVADVDVILRVLVAGERASVMPAE